MLKVICDACGNNQLGRSDADLPPQPVGWWVAVGVTRQTFDVCSAACCSKMDAEFVRGRLPPVAWTQIRRGDARLDGTVRAEKTVVE